MASKIIEINGKPNYYSQKQYLLNDIDEIHNLPRVGFKGKINDPNDTVINEPCAFGSTAVVCTGSSTEVYILNSDNNWTKM